jgi:hypothetical protein
VLGRAVVGCERGGDLGLGGVVVGVLFPVDLPPVGGVPEVRPHLHLLVEGELVAEGVNDLSAAASATASWRSYNGHRPHQSRDQRPPDTETQPTRDTTGLMDLRSIRRKRVVAGVISEYRHVA